MLRVALLSFALSLVACKDKAPPTTPGSASGTGSGAALQDGYQAQGKKPENARRPAPPPSLAPLAVGAAAPGFELASATGAAWSLAQGLGKFQKVVIVFYRGDW